MQMPSVDRKYNAEFVCQELSGSIILNIQGSHLAPYLMLISGYLMNQSPKGTNKDKIDMTRNEIIEILPIKDLSIEINVRKYENKDRTSKSNVNKCQPSLRCCRTGQGFTNNSSLRPRNRQGHKNTVRSRQHLSKGLCWRLS